MSEFNEEDFEAYEADLHLLVDTLRVCFNSEHARYQVVGHKNALFIEIEGLEDLTPEEISEVAEPVLEELDMDFEQISLLPLKK